MPTVSVVIPTYNHADYLPVAIRSVLDQSYPDLEIIVVDDGSTDDTHQVVTYFDGPIRYIYQENRGLSAARNAGIAESRGKFIGFLDADDCYDPDYLNQMVTALAQNVTAGAAYCGYRMIDSENRPLPQKSDRFVLPDNLYEAMLFGNFLVPHCVFTRRESFESTGTFDESLTACEDWDLWLRISRQVTMIPVRFVLALYRVRPDSMSGDVQRMLENRLAVLDKQARMAGESRIQRARGYAFRATALEWLQAGDEAKALATFRSAAERYPELLNELETYYELALWNQPKGSRGDLQHIDLRLNKTKMMGFLDQYFSASGLPSECLSRRDVAYSRAYEALGWLSYSRRELSEARYYLNRSLRTAPAGILNRRLMSLYARSIMRSGYQKPWSGN